MLHQELIDNIVNRIVKTYNPLTIYMMGMQYWTPNEIPNDIDLKIIVQSSPINDPNGIPNQAPIDRAEIGYKALEGVPGEKFILVFTKDEWGHMGQEQRTTYLFTQKYGIKIYECN